MSETTTKVPYRLKVHHLEVCNCSWMDGQHTKEAGDVYDPKSIESLIAKV